MGEEEKITTIEELIAYKKNATGTHNYHKYDKVFLKGRDLFFAEEIEKKSGEPMRFEISELSYGRADGGHGFKMDNGFITELFFNSKYLYKFIIPKSIWHLENLKRLVLIGMNIEDFESSLGNIESLEELGLVHSNIKELPESIGNLKHLKTLRILNCNELQRLPETLGNLANLESIELEGGKLERIPKLIGNLANLQSIEIHYTEITKLPETIGNLKNLTNLNLASNKIDALPHTIGNLERLEQFCIALNYLTVIPEEIGNLKSLKSLKIGHELYTASENNCINRLPSSLGKLERLEKLILSGIGLESIPETIGDLGTLEILFLNHNKLRSIPESIGQLKKLKKLVIKENILENLPESIEGMELLEEIDLEKNNILTLPSAIGKMAQLKKLLLKDNKQTVYNSVPSDFIRSGYTFIKQTAKDLTDELTKSLILQSRKDFEINKTDRFNLLKKFQYLNFFIAKKSNLWIIYPSAGAHITYMKQEKFLKELSQMDFFKQDFFSGITRMTADKFEYDKRDYVFFFMSNSNLIFGIFLEDKGDYSNEDCLNLLGIVNDVSQAISENEYDRLVSKIPKRREGAIPMLETVPLGIASMRYHKILFERISQFLYPYDEEIWIIGRWVDIPNKVFKKLDGIWLPPELFNYVYCHTFNFIYLNELIKKVLLLRYESSSGMYGDLFMKNNIENCNYIMPVFSDYVNAKMTFSKYILPKIIEGAPESKILILIASEKPSNTRYIQSEDKDLTREGFLQNLEVSVVTRVDFDSNEFLNQFACAIKNLMDKNQEIQYNSEGLTEDTIDPMEKDFILDLERVLIKKIPIYSDISMRVFGIELRDRHIRTIKIIGQRLKELPESIGSCIYIEKLFLHDNELLELPINIGKVEHLSFINLMNNSLTSLPESIGNLKHLKRLILVKNALKSIPNSICELKMLETLNISQNEIKILPPDIGSFSSILKLDFSNNPLKNLPQSVGGQFLGDTLILKDMNITTIPDSFCNLKNIKKLIIENIPVKALPDNLGNLTELEELNITKVPLQNLPPSFGGLLKLKTLKIWETQLDSLPKSIQKISSIEKIDIHKNNCKFIPDIFISLNNLKELNISDMPIDKLPNSLGSLSKLEKLRIKNTNIKNLPENIGELKNLEELYFYKNKLDDLPLNIKNLSRLKSFSLYEDGFANPTEKLENIFKKLDQIGCKLFVSNHKLLDFKKGSVFY